MLKDLYKGTQAYSAFVVLIGLMGCQDGGEKAPENGTPDYLVPATISAQNANFITEYQDRYRVDLSDKVSVSGGKSFTLREVVPLSNTAECQPLEIMAQSFTIAAQSSKSCDYEYKVAVSDAPQAAASATSEALAPASLVGAPTDIAVTRIAVTSEASTEDSQIELTAISAVTLIGEQVAVDVKEQLLYQASFTVPEGYSLSTELSLPYSGNVATAEPLTNTITYTPPGGFQGIERILFSYENNATGEVLLGTLDIAVSVTANQGLMVEDDITHDDVAINELVTIDVTPYVTSLDGDGFQLVYVDSFNAATAPLDPDDVSNKQFTFETSQMGNHYVSFAVSDNNGAYAMGLVEVPAFDPNKTGQWDGISYQGVYFTAPLTTQEASGKQVTYNETLVDNYYTPSVDLALFSAGNALNYCGLEGRLPTPEELTQLSSDSVQTKHNWPISEQYIAKDDSTYKTVELTTGLVTGYLGGNYIVSCIEGGLTVQPPTTETIANGVKEAKIVFTLLGQGEEPIAGPTINFTVQSESNQAALVTLNEATDVNGQAIARVSNIKAEDVTVCGEVGIQNTCTTARFIGDPATAEIVNTEHDVTGWTPGDSTIYPLEVTVQDTNQNSVSGVLVTFNELINKGLNTEEMKYVNATRGDNGLEVRTGLNGIAYIEVLNDKETDVSDETVIGVTHINESAVTTNIQHKTYWGAWQWEDPLEVRIGNQHNKAEDMTDSRCSTYGPEWRLMTNDEMNEYENAIDVHPLMMTGDTRSAVTDPLWNAGVRAIEDPDVWYNGNANNPKGIGYVEDGGFSVVAMGKNTKNLYMPFHGVYGDIHQYRSYTWADSSNYYVTHEYKVDVSSYDDYRYDRLSLYPTRREQGRRYSPLCVKPL